MIQINDALNLCTGDSLTWGSTRLELSFTKAAINGSSTDKGYLF